MPVLFSYKHDIGDPRKFNNCAIQLPNEDNKWLSFSNHCRKKRIPFVVYADVAIV